MRCYYVNEQLHLMLKIQIMKLFNAELCIAAHSILAMQLNAPTVIFNLYSNPNLQLEVAHLQKDFQEIW